MDGLDFIEDFGLRKKIEDSMEFAYALRGAAEWTGKNALYREEANRVVILYAVAAIEAILLYVYKKFGKPMTSVEYKFAQSLGGSYRYLGHEDSPVVIAVKEKGNKDVVQIGMNDLIVYFEERALFVEKGMAADVSLINGLRNTFHLSKSREKTACDVVQVESALKLLVDVIKQAPHALSKRMNVV